MKSKSIGSEPLGLVDYQDRACAANQFRGVETAIDQLRFGFFGEIGGVLAAVKKSHREFGAGEAATVHEELGDALWYLAAVTREYKHSLDAVGASAIAELTRRYHPGTQPLSANLTFDQLDGLVAFCTPQIAVEPTETHLQRLGARAGELLILKSDLATVGPVEALGRLLGQDLHEQLVLLRGRQPLARPAPRRGPRLDFGHLLQPFETETYRISGWVLTTDLGARTLTRNGS